MYGRKKFVLLSGFFLIGIMISATSNFLVVGDIPNQINVSNNDTLQNKDPVIAAVGTVAHIVWTRQVNYTSEESEIVYSNNKSGSFSNFVNISTNPGRDDNPAIAVGSNDALHVAWLSQNSSTSKMDLCYANMIGGVWSAPLVIDFNVTADSTDIAISSNGVVHIVYGIHDGHHWTVWHIDNHTGSFDAKTQLSPSIGLIVDDFNPHVVVDSSDRAHVIWNHEHELSALEDPPGGSVYTVMYSEQLNTTTFSPPIEISSTDYTCNQIDITIGTSDTVHFVWTQSSARFSPTLGCILYGNCYYLVYANKSLNGTFSDTIVISNPKYHTSFPSITTDSSGAVHIVWEHSGDVHYANNKAGSFSNASYALIYGGWQYNPDITAVDSTVMIAWERKDSHNNTEIYFVSGEASELLEGLGPDPRAGSVPVYVLLLGIIAAAVIHLKKKRR